MAVPAAAEEDLRGGGEGVDGGSCPTPPLKAPPLPPQEGVWVGVGGGDLGACRARVRRFTPEADSGGVAVLYRQVLGEHGIKSKQVERIEKEIPSIADLYTPARRAGFWCLEVEGGGERVVVGTVALCPWARVSKTVEHRVETSETVCEIKRLYLARRYRGHGWGRALLQFAEEMARALQYEDAWLDSPKRFRAARRLYLSHGYAEGGSTSCLVYMKRLGGEGGV